MIDGMEGSIFDAAEKYQSQVPALQMLVALGFKPLSQAEALTLRGGRLRNVVLDDILAEKLLAINRFTYRGREYAFDLEDAHEAMRRLKPTPDRLKGLRGTNQDIYDTLVLGTTITKTIDGDSKSYSFRFVDWEHPENNVFHVTAEVSVERTASTQSKRCDIVAYVNGIPFVVIENKRPTESLKKAGSQLIGYQSEDNIPQLFHFAQLLVTMNRQESRFATVGTPQKFWQTWRDEEDTDATVTLCANRRLTADEKGAIFSGDFAAARPHFEAMVSEGDRAVTAQDRTIFALCRPERLLDMVRRFTVFDGGNRKIARHPQFFGIRKAVDRLKQFDLKGVRKGGVIWHTQGSGKSLTMVMLGRSLALDKDISNPRIIIVTDRDDLDKQIKDTFKSCELTPVRATSGSHLFELIRDKKPLITTIINKFDSAVRGNQAVDADEPGDTDCLKGHVESFPEKYRAAVASIDKRIRLKLGARLIAVGISPFSEYVREFDTRQPKLKEKLSGMLQTIWACADEFEDESNLLPWPEENSFSIQACAEESKFLTAEEAAAYLGGLNSRTLTRWAREGYIPAIPIGEGKRRLWRFLRTDLESWMLARRQGGQNAA